jgi:tetratricopeptide (TPR) repeat protein
MYRRASRSGNRINYHHGVAEALVRQIDLVDTGTSLETVAQMQRQALEAAEQTNDLGLISRILLMHAETLTRIGRMEDVVPVLADSVEIAREIGDLTLESRCLQALVDVEERLKLTDDAATHMAEWIELEDRLGNRTQAGKIAERLGMTLLQIGEPGPALDAFDRARAVATTLRDPRMEQKAYGGLGIAHAQLRHPGEAIDNLMKALQIARDSGDHLQEATWLATISQTLIQYGQTDEAIRAINDGLAVSRRTSRDAWKAVHEAGAGAQSPRGVPARARNL